MRGCDFMRKKFTVSSGKGQDAKKCFKADCINEDEACETCYMVQGKYTNYQGEPHNEQAIN